ncbi:glycosyltransferase family 2 protein [Paenibacillus agilis]|uniref:Glycosyltransferase n=1 Tax=Paenibacillus agilis TaxID=3020863 RepID=A0A559IZT8_9BACL|nr:glycosyltransferase [Paenibacillus agilis]TVX93123.1 glycosyltransferase [Paenibacillus agilis]
MMNEQHKRILIGSPIHQKPRILKEFLHSLLQLHHPHIEIHYFFVDDNIEHESREILQQFQLKTKHTLITPSNEQSHYECNNTTHYWHSDLVWKVAAFKNSILKHAIEQKFDYVFLVDSDLVLHPNTVEQLVAVDKPIVSEIFWTKWIPETVEQPQVWLYDEYTQWERQQDEFDVSEEEQLQRIAQFFNKMKIPGLYEVGGLGACTLIRRDALLTGVSFTRIPNISYWGEDRHFCIRAAALGIPLYVDTHYPAFHLYRESDLEQFLTSKPLENAADIKYEDISPTKNNNLPTSSITIRERPKLTLTMVIRNEASRYLQQTLVEHRKYIDEAVIIDDGSTDNSSEICKELLANIPLRLIRNEQSKFSNEIQLRQQQWAETIQTKPDWILNLDADEQFESNFGDHINDMLKANSIDCYCFRLFDLWNETHYREDQYWHAHLYYRPFLIRYREDFQPVWKETPQHCGRFPINVLELKHQLSPLRLKHFGWAKHEHRIEKYNRYMELDPGARYGWKEQYDSILDQNPLLIPWDQSQF